jgi:hypothetical protein
MRLLVPICSQRPPKFFDPTYTLQAGAHPFVVAPSYAYYRGTRTDSDAHIINLVDKQYFKQREDMDGAIVAALLAGVPQSQFTPRFAVTYLERWPNT